MPGSVTAEPPEKRDPPLRDEPPRGRSKATRRFYDPHPPRTAIILLRRITQDATQDDFHFRKPPRKSPPVILHTLPPTLDISSGLPREIPLNRGAANDSVRLRKIREQAHCQAAAPATKPPHRHSQYLRTGAGKPARIIAESAHRGTAGAVRTHCGSPHRPLPLALGIPLRRPRRLHDHLHGALMGRISVGRKNLLAHEARQFLA